MVSLDCDRITGRCTHGCQSGWGGDRCTIGITKMISIRKLYSEALLIENIITNLENCDEWIKKQLTDEMKVWIKNIPEKVILKSI